MFNIFTYTKNVTNLSKFSSDIKVNQLLGSAFNFINVKGLEVEIHFKSNLNQQQIDELELFVSSFSNVSVVETYTNYLNSNIDPFGASMMVKIRAENITMGITQAGKTWDVLGFFNHGIQLPGKLFPISFAMAFDSGSFYEVIALINYFLVEENKAIYSTLAPFITPERLTEWQTEIITKLST